MPRAIATAPARSSEGIRAPRPRRSSLAGYPAPAEASASVTLDELARFFKNPMRAFLRERVGLWLDETEADVLDREPMALDALEDYKLGTDLLARALDGDDLVASYDLVRASGVLPLGAVGRCRYERALPEIDEMAVAVRAHQEGERLDPREVDLRLDGERVTGWIRDLWPKGRLAYRFGRANASAELSMWIHHLALQCVAASGDPRESVLIARDKERGAAKVVRLGAIEAREARARLADLVRWYRVGQMLPLRFFPEASRAYAKARRGGKSEDEAAADARKSFQPRGGSAGAPSEAEDPSVARVLGGRDPVDPGLQLVGDPGLGEPLEPTFAELAEGVFGPLIEHREEPAHADA